MHCCLHMFKQLPDVNHFCKMNNLFMSVGLTREAYSLPTQVFVHGVIWKSKQDVPLCVLQEDKTGKAAKKAGGTMKAAVLKNDSKSHNLIVTSCYDQKPFHMMSHSIEEITWVKHEIKVFSQALRKLIMLTYLQFNLLHDYNFEMNDNNVADQLQLIYCMMRFQRNMK